MRTFTSRTLFLIGALTLSACGPQRPVLYPNSHLKEIGQPKANQDIDECIKLATEYQAGNSKGEEVAKNTGKAGVVGAATGAVVGAFSGNAGRGAAMGGAGAATAVATP